jgi:hypothetical protein
MQMVAERFMRVYSDLPLKLRKEIVMVIDEEPITWNAAYIEVKNNTEKGKRILEKLASLGII